MAAETLTSDRAGTGFPVSGVGHAGNLKIGWGTYQIAANVEDGDIFEMHWVHDGATVIGGWTIAEDLDTGIETIDIDLGWAANNTDAADPDGLGNFGVWTGDTSVHVVGAVNYFPHQGVLVSAGPKTFTAGAGHTMIQLEANAVAATFAAGQVTVATFYTVD